MSSTNALPGGPASGSRSPPPPVDGTVFSRRQTPPHPGQVYQHNLKSIRFKGQGPGPPFRGNNVIFPLMQNHAIGRTSFHYGWVIVATGTLSILACLGFGRFALGMLLPSMAATLHLSYSEMGFISTANFLGYLASVLVSGHWAGRFGSRRFIFAALLVVGCSMALVSRATGFLSVLVLYMITGIGSGATNVPMMGLVSSWFSSSQRGRAAGFIVIGSGFAIMIAGRLIPYINLQVGAEAGGRAG